MASKAEIHQVGMGPGGVAMGHSQATSASYFITPHGPPEEKLYLRSGGQTGFAALSAGAFFSGWFWVCLKTSIFSLVESGCVVQAGLKLAILPPKD